jgi:hypothetical protein
LNKVQLIRDRNWPDQETSIQFVKEDYVATLDLKKAAEQLDLFGRECPRQIERRVRIILTVNVAAKSFGAQGRRSQSKERSSRHDAPRRLSRTAP